MVWGEVEVLEGRVGGGRCHGGFGDRGERGIYALFITIAIHSNPYPRPIQFTYNIHPPHLLINAITSSSTTNPLLTLDGPGAISTHSPLTLHVPALV